MKTRKIRETAQHIGTMETDNRRVVLGGILGRGALVEKLNCIQGLVTSVGVRVMGCDEPASVMSRCFKRKLEGSTGTLHCVCSCSVT